MRSPRPLPRWRPKASRCVGASPPAPMTMNGASGACWPASMAIRSSGCARRSSRSPPAISCAFSWPGSASRPMRACKGPMRWRWWPRSSKASRRRPAPGKARSCRRGSANTSPPGSTINASPDGYHGRGLGRAMSRPAAAIAAPRPCARRPSRFSRAATPRSGHRSRPAWMPWNRAPMPRPSPASSAITAPPSSTSWWTAPACCALRPRTRSPSWSPWAW